MKKADLYEKTNKIKIIMAIVRTADILDRYLEGELAKHGSNPTRFGAMNALFVHGGTMTPTAISKWLFRTKHSITSMLERLNKAGLIQRERSTTDGRSVNISITSKGWNSTRKMVHVADRISESALSCFKEEELDVLMVLLKRLRKHLLEIMS